MGAPCRDFFHFSSSGNQNTVHSKSEEPGQCTWERESELNTGTANWILMLELF